MKIRYLTLSLVIFCLPLFAQENDQDKQASIQPVAEEYVKLYAGVEFEKYSAFYTDESIFEDPTAEIFYPDKKHPRPVGKEAILKDLKKGFQWYFRWQLYCRKEILYR